MTPAEAAAELQQHFGPIVREILTFRGDTTVLVERDAIEEVAAYCRSNLSLNFLSDITATDWLDRHPRFDVVYQLTSLVHWFRLTLKVQVDEGESIPSLIPLWPAANWAEREVWDLFGIDFAGHPDLTRLLLPEGWIGHPLRKDFAQTQIVLPRPRADKVEE